MPEIDLNSAFEHALNEGCLTEEDIDYFTKAGLSELLSTVEAALGPDAYAIFLEDLAG